MAILNEHGFLDLIYKRLNKGQGFTAFVGSGVSKASGVMMGRDFTNYLAYTFARCVMPIKTQRILFHRTGNRSLSIRDLREDGWPNFPNQKQVRESCRWIGLLFLEQASLSYNSEATTGGYKTAYELIASIRCAFEKNGMLTEEHEEALEAVVKSLSNEGVEKKYLRPLVPEVLKSDVARQDPWINLIAKEIMVDDEYIIKRWEIAHGREAIRRLTKHEALPGNTLYERRFILEAGVKSLYDWRATLEFLASLQLINGKNSRVQIRLRANPETWIIDSFNSHLGKKKLPNLAHQMLVHLARPLHIETYLTTNFDTLLEQAFKAMDSPISVIPVSRGGGMPDPVTVLGQRTIIKLHGTEHETRADFSLDATPSVRDQQAFVNYLQYNPKLSGDLEEPVEQSVSAPKHLLVTGFSGSDRRIIEYFKSALNQRSELEIFWIVNSRGTKYSKMFPEDKTRIHIVETRQTDLLLYELYQKVSRRLPPSGFTYQFLQYVPALVRKSVIIPSKSNTASEGEWAIDCKTEVDGLAKRAKESNENLDGDHSIVTGWGRLEEKLGQAAFHKKKFAGVWWYPTKPDSSGKVLLLDGYSGVSPIARELHDQLKRAYRECIWMELEDYANAASFSRDLIQLVAHRVGMLETQASKFDISSQDLKRPAILDRKLRAIFSQFLEITSENWVIFIYARSCPGSCAGWNDQPWDYDDPKAPARIEFHNLLNALCQHGFTVVYMPYTRARHQKFVDRNSWLRDKQVNEIEELTDWEQFLEGEPKQDELFHFGLEVAQAPLRAEARKSGKVKTAQGPEFSWIEDKTASLGEFTFLERAKEHFGSGKDWKEFASFLFSISLFRQSRHPAALISHAVIRCPEMFNTRFFDNDVYRSKKAYQYLAFLEKHGVCSRKHGGYQWMFADTRRTIVSVLDSESVDGSDIMRFGNQKASIHNGISEWFLHAFFSSEHASTLMESLYHRFVAIREVGLALPMRSRGGMPEGELCRFRLDLIKLCLLKIIKTFELARRSNLFWMQKEVSGYFFSKEAIRKALGGIEDGDIGRWLIRLVDLSCISKQDIKEEYGELFENLVSQVFEGAEAIEHELRRGDGIVEFRFVQTSTEATQFPDHETFIKHYSGKQPILVDAWSKDGNPWKPLEEHTLSVVVFGTDEKLSEIKSVLGCSREKYWEISDSDFLKGYYNTRNLLFRSVRKSSLFNFHLCADVIYSLTYYNARKAKLLGRIWNLEPSSEEKGEVRNQAISLWRSVCAGCSLIIELSSQLESSYLNRELRLKFDCYLLYGLALGYLGRYSEAYRRLNEATFLLKQFEVKEVSILRAMVHLRRAEIDLSHARYYRQVMDQMGQGKESWLQFDEEVRFSKLPESGDFLPVDSIDQFWVGSDDGIGLSETSGGQDQAFSLHISKVNDAISQLDTAEKIMAGDSHSSLWWGRLISLRFWTYISLDSDAENEVLLGSKSLAYRSRSDQRELLQSWFAQGVQISSSDPYRRMRIVELFQASMLAVYRVRVVVEGLEPDRAFSLASEDFRDILRGYAEFRDLASKESLCDSDSDSGAKDGFESMLRSFIFASEDVVGGDRPEEDLSQLGKRYCELTLSEICKTAFCELDESKK